ncbi:glycosyltransferase [Granulicella arctica]|uniref:glycosyltransferase n=1 Tax=Granulicella arctica TaxID=940613 RepID=UPI0021DF9C1A|nr:glycosyltransferase [Granulicella arctica]
MRILHIVGTIDPKAGGVSDSIRALLEYGPSDYEHEVASMDDPAAPFLADLPVPTHAFGPVTSTFAYGPKLRPWLLANRDRFDGVFVHGLWVYCGIAAWQALAGHTPYVVFPHGMLDPYFKHAFPLKHLKKWLYWLPAQYWVLRRADKVLFTCDVEAELARQSFWLHRWNPHVVAFGATAPLGDAAEHNVQRQAFLNLFPQLQDRRFLLFLGRIHHKKGCDLLIDAFIKIAAKDADLDLVMAGPDQQHWQAALMETVAAAGLTHRVHWTGMLEGEVKWGAFFASEAFILPSHQENFGIAVAEALACSRPVLLSDKVNIAPDIALDGAGLMETDTAEGTLRLLERWIALSAAERETMAQQARLTFERRYDMRANAKSIVRIFETPT